MVFKSRRAGAYNPVFVKKLKILCSSDQHVVQYFIKKMTLLGLWRDFRTIGYEYKP